MNTTIRASVAAAVVAATVLTPSVALAKGGGGGGNNITSGTCGAVTFKLKADAKPANQVGAAFEVDANVTGQQWRVVIVHNGTRVMRQVFTTNRVSGSFTARQLVPNAAGTDTFRAHAVRLSDGVRCAGSVTF